MKGYEDNGYVLTAPHVSIKIDGNEVSGTVMRNLLGSPSYETNRKKLFKQAFGYFDQGIFNMMTNKFKKLFEFRSFCRSQIVKQEPKRNRRISIMIKRILLALRLRMRVTF